MFSSTPQTLPVRQRAWGIGLGTLIMVGVPIMTISAKTVQFTLPILLAAALAGAIARDRLAYARPRFDAVSLCLLLLIFYAGLSALWARDPLTSVSASLMAAVVLIGSITLIQLLRSEPIEDALHMGEGLWIGVAVGALYTVLEAGSGQAIKMFVYNALELGPDVLEPARYFTWENGRVIAIHPDDLTRNAVPIPLLLWPALMAAVALPAGFWRRLVCAALLVLCFAAVFMATSETAKLALSPACSPTGWRACPPRLRVTPCQLHGSRHAWLWCLWHSWHAVSICTTRTGCKRRRKSASPSGARSRISSRNRPSSASGPT